MGELADEGIDLAQRERGRCVTLEVAADEAVVGDPELQGGSAGGGDDGSAVLLDQAEHAEDATHAEGAVSAVDRLAEGADGGAGPRGLAEQRQRGRRGPRRPIVGMDGVMATRLAAMLAEQG